jgi:PilZ domain-containing protein
MNDRRTARRYGLALPVKMEQQEPAPRPEPFGCTREISRSGLYFTADAAPAPGSMVSLTLTLPGTLTGGEGVLVEVMARIVRIEPAEATADGRIGVAARIERYEIVRASAAQAN